jgi:hypothetical protein
MPDQLKMHDVISKIEDLQREIGILKDINEIRSLHNIYGYYLDKCLYDEVVDLFSENSTAYFLNGIYRGKEGVRRLMCGFFRNLFTNGYNGPVYGFLLDHLQLQDVITVSPDRSSAKGRFRCFMQGGVHESRPDIPGFPAALWEAGVYENGFVREEGIWKIGSYDYSMLWQAGYTRGWSQGAAFLQPLTKTFPEDPHGPDELLPEPQKVWPETRVVPFHYPHPVTGKCWEGPVLGIRPT